MTALPPDHEDGLPADPRERSTLPPEAYASPDPHEEITKVETPAPKRRDTPVVTAADLLAALSRLEGKVDSINTRVAAIDRGLGAANDELGALRSDMNTGFDAVRTMILGSGDRPGLAQGVDATNRLAGDALAKATLAATAALEASTLAQQVYDHVLDERRTDAPAQPAAAKTP